MMTYANEDKIVFLVLEYPGSMTQIMRVYKIGFLSLLRLIHAKG